MLSDLKNEEEKAMGEDEDQRKILGDVRDENQVNMSEPRDSDNEDTVLLETAGFLPLKSIHQQIQQ